MTPDHEPTDAELIEILRSDAEWLKDSHIPGISRHVARAAERLKVLAAERRVERMEAKLAEMERERDERCAGPVPGTASLSAARQRAGRSGVGALDGPGYAGLTARGHARPGPAARSARSSPGRGLAPRPRHSSQ